MYVDYSGVGLGRPVPGICVCRLRANTPEQSQQEMIQKLRAFHWVVDPAHVDVGPDAHSMCLQDSGMSILPIQRESWRTCTTFRCRTDRHSWGGMTFERW